MLAYILKRLLIAIPTLLGITIMVFVIINLAPGSPIEQKIQNLRFASGAGGEGSAASSASASGTKSSAGGVSQEVLDALNRQYGFDKPMLTRYGIWLKNLARLDFGKSFQYQDSTLKVIVSKFPVSLMFGITSFILSYLICIILGVFLALKDNTGIDRVASFFLFVAYSIPPFMLAILLIVYFAGGSFWSFFPTGGLISDYYDDLSSFEKIGDRLSHMILPLLCYMIGSFTSLTVLVKNSLLEEIKKDYIRTARAKGVTERRVIFHHALRNSLIPLVAGMGSFLSVFFAGSLFLETIFQLDGIGLLGYKSVLSRDYNVLMALVFLQSVAMLLGNLFSDIIYTVVDPRIDFK